MPNISHEKQHNGQVWNIRAELRLLQGNAAFYRLLVDYHLSSEQLISSSFGLTEHRLTVREGRSARTSGELCDCASCLATEFATRLIPAATPINGGDG